MLGIIMDPNCVYNTLDANEYTARMHPVNNYFFCTQFIAEYRMQNTEQCRRIHRMQSAEQCQIQNTEQHRKYTQTQLS